MRGVGELAELPRDKEGHLLGDVHRVVTDPLDGATRHTSDPPLQHRLVVRGRKHLLQHAAVQPVKGIVQLGEAAREVEIAARERVHRRPHHPKRDRAHLPKVLQHRRVGWQAVGELGDLQEIHRLIGNAFQMQVDVQQGLSAAVGRGGDGVWSANRCRIRRSTSR